jgi:hypothetical protein
MAARPRFFHCGVVARRSYSRLVTAKLAVLLAVCALAGGCGVRSSKPFTATGTASCLKSHSFTRVTTNPGAVGFIAGFADNGGLRAASPLGNILTIAFTGGTDAVASTEEAFRSHAPKSLRPHMSDIMTANRNAVLVWTTTPDPGELDTAQRCLKP